MPGGLQTFRVFLYYIIMVNNFETIKNLLKFDKPGDCYYLQLLRRQSDDPMIGGMPDPNYHGNMHSRSIKDYFIPSLEYFEQKKDEIITMCNTFNVRAYIRLNKRNYAKIAMMIMKHIVEQLVSGQTFNSPFSLIASAAGMANCAGKNKTWILDLDEEYVPYKEDIYRMIVQCEPYKSMFNNSKIPYEEFLKENFTEIPTKHGLHIVSKGFDTTTFKNLWTAYTEEYCITAPLPQLKVETIDKDGTPTTTTVFSLTGYYLKHVKGLVEILSKYCETKTIKIDKNKTIIHAYGNFVLADVDAEWKDYCIKHTLYMKQFDCHKDNPTLMFCP